MLLSLVQYLSALEKLYKSLLKRRERGGGEEVFTIERERNNRENEVREDNVEFEEREGH